MKRPYIYIAALAASISFAAVAPTQASEDGAWKIGAVSGDVQIETVLGTRTPVAGMWIGPSHTVQTALTAG